MKKSHIIALLFLLGFCISSAFAVEVTLYGPEQFTRQEGKPYVFTDTFPGRIGQGMLIVTNGTLGGTNRVSSAIIKVNGQVVCGTNDFNLEVYHLEIPVNLGENNTISVELRSEVGSYLSIEIKQEIEADAAMVFGSEGGIVEVADSNSPIDGYSITIPAGALNEPEVISIEHISDIQYPINPAKEIGIDLPAFRILPDNQYLNVPAVICIPYDDVDGDGIIDGTDLPAIAAKLFVITSGDTEMFRVDAIIDTDVKNIVAYTWHFTDWSVWVGHWVAGSTVDYFIQNVPHNEFYDESTFWDEIKQAFDLWSYAIDGIVTFERTYSQIGADVIIDAYDLCSFWLYFWIDCRRVKAIAYRPFLGLTSGTVSFNTGISFIELPRLWVTENYEDFPPDHGNYYDHEPFFRWALHEFGHVMGLPDYTDLNTNDPCNWQYQEDWAVMYYDCGIDFAFTSLSDFDVDEVRKLYGLPDQCTTLMCGDVNGDFEITPADAQLAFDIYMGTFPNPTFCQLESADVNCDGTQSEPWVDVDDATEIFNKFLGISELPCDCLASSRPPSFRESESFISNDIEIGYFITEDNNEIVVSIFVEHAEDVDVDAFGFDFIFPSEYLEFVALERSNILDAFHQVGANLIADGVLRVGGYSSVPITILSSDILLTLRFRPIEDMMKSPSFEIINTVGDFK